MLDGQKSNDKRLESSRKKKYKGRKSVITKDFIKTIEKYKDLIVSVTGIAKITGKSRSTIYKVLKEELGYISNRLIKNDKVVIKTQLNDLISLYFVDTGNIYLS